MAQRIDVMISSTARDLPDYRQQAMDACVRQGMFPIMMEHLPAMAEDAISASLSMVDEAEIYLGIFAGRYGYIPRGYKISITEMEYNHAGRRGIPRLIFIMNDEITEPSDEDDQKSAKQVAFKERLKQDQVVNFFSSPADLRAQIINSLSHFQGRQTRTMYRPTIIPEAPEPYVAHPYTLLESGELVGRSQELQRLDDWIAAPDSAPIMNIVALGGMGKSSLTWKWFHQQRDWNGRLWWSFYESDAHYENFLTRTLAYVSNETEDALLSASLAERENRLISLLDQHPFLLVLDGLERIMIAYNQETRPKPNAPVGSQAHKKLRKMADPRAGAFLRRLAAVRSSRILTSTRLYPSELENSAGKPLPGSTFIALEGLSDEDALNLWYSFDLTGSDDALLPLFQSFDNYPLLIRALAGEVARYRRAPGDFDAWRKANPKFDPFGLPMVQRQSHILTYALNGLDASEMQVLRTIAAFRAPASYGTLADLLVGEFFDDETQLDLALTELEDRGLMGWDRTANRYDLHPVVRGIIWHELDEGTQRSLYEKLRVHLGAIPIIGDWRSVARREELTASMELYHTLVGLKHYDEAYDLLSNRLYRPLRYRFSDGQTLLNMLEMLFPDDEPLPRLSEPGAQAWTLNALAQSHQMVGQPSEAVPLFERSNNLKEAAHHTIDLSTGLRDLAYAQRLVGRLRLSEAASRRALMIDRGEENHLLEAISLQVLGLALAARGAYDESARALDRSLDLADRTNANRAYNHQAMRALWIGDHQAALEWSDKGIEYSRGRHLEHALILARRLHGTAALRLGDLRTAEDRLHRGLVQARAANLMEEEIAALIALAELRHMQGRPEAARELLDDVWPVVESAPYTLLHADACNALVFIERQSGNHDLAVEAAARAYHLAWCDGTPYAYQYGLDIAAEHLTALGVVLPQLPLFDPATTMPMVAVEIDPGPPQE